jgi:hypothetical protein
VSRTLLNRQPFHPPETADELKAVWLPSSWELIRLALREDNSNYGPIPPAFEIEYLRARKTLEDRAVNAPRSDADPARGHADAKPNEGTGTAPALSPSRHKAYGQYLWAVSRNAALVGATDRQVYDWLRENGKDESLATFATWGRYLREARAFHDAQKNTPRIGRKTGRSIARPEEI